MNATASELLHILAFQCPQCEKPVVESMLSSMRSLESIDGSLFNVQCPCGWSDQRLGAQARRHIVLPWSAPDQPSARDAEEGASKEGREEDTLNTL
jgi:hypothetical protein